MIQKVSVVGAGLARLTAAYRLWQKGYDIDVFEARNRVGGRVHSVFIKNLDNGYSIGELGGQNIADGGNARHILSLAKEFHLKTLERDIELSFPFYDGKKLHNYRTLLKTYLTNNQTIYQTFKALKTSAHSMQDALDYLFEPASLLKRVFALQLSSYEGSPPHLLCLDHNLETLKKMILGELYTNQSSPDAAPMIHSITLKDGNALLPLKLREKMGNSIHLNKTLKAVREDGDHIMLLFQDGTTTFCDKLILATPCSVYSDIIFDPKIIRAEKLQDMKKVQYGSNAKILIPIKTSGFTYSAMMTDKMVAFFSADQKLLNLYFSRESGKHLLKNLNDLFQESLVALKLGFDNSKIEERRPILAKDEQFIRYDQPVAHSWYEDPYVRGSYSNFGIALKEQFSRKTTYRGIEVKSLFEPLKDRVFFIGEHTTILDEIGTMEAAVESGERIAELF